MKVTVERGKALGAMVVGITEAVLGVLIAILSFVVMSRVNSVNLYASPYWSGLILIVPGIFGFIAGITKNQVIMIVYMVLNILSFLILAATCIMSGVFLSSYTLSSCDWSYDACYCNGSRTSYTKESCDLLQSVISMLYAIVAFTVISAIVTLIGSIIGCAAVCCSGTAPQQSLIVQQQPGMVDQSGYPPQLTGYPAPQAGYPAPQAGYPQQQAGYPPQQAGYPPQQAGYPPQQAGNPPQQAGYPPQQAGNPPQQTGLYPSPQGTDPQQMPPQYTEKPGVV